MKKHLSLLLILVLSSPVWAVEFSDVNYPKPPAYRVGLTDEPENKYVEAKPEMKKETVKIDVSQQEKEALTYADLSIKRMSKDISKELDFDQETMVGDLSLLWQGAATKSETIGFAVYKLSNPDENKPDEKSVKKVLTTIASMSTLIGAGMGSPMLAAGSMLSGNVLGIMSQDTKALNYKFTKVTDADMIILVRKIEDLQQRTVNLYYDYMTAKKKIDMIEKVVTQRKKNYDMAQDGSREIILITDAYYRSSLDMKTKARSDFIAKRAALEQFVGNDVFKQFEDNIEERDAKESKPEKKK